MRRRGSALVYVIIVVFSITSVVLVSAKMSSASEGEYQNALAQAQFKGLADGAVAETFADSYKRVASVGTRTTNFSLANVTTEVKQHPTITRAYQLAITGTVGGKNFTQVKTVGKRETPNPAYYGLWVNSDYSDSLLATTVNGSAYMAANATLSGPWTVTEDFLVRGTATISLGTTVSGSQLTGVRLQTMPTFTHASYASETTSTSSNNQGNFTFSGLDAQGKYPGLNRGGNFTMNGGTISGKGFLVVGGNLNINGNYNYADSNSRMLVLVAGNMNVNALATEIVGTYLVLGRVNLNGVTLNVPRGNICTDKDLRRLTCALTVTQDDGFLEGVDERVKHRLPGFFP